MSTIAEIPIDPVVVALQSIRRLPDGASYRLTGIDLESGRSVRIDIEYEPPSERSAPISNLLLTLALVPT